MHRISFVACLAALLLASPIAGAQVTSVWVRANGNGEVGQGVFLNGAHGCLLLTAAHLVNGATEVEWRTGAANGRGRVGQRNFNPDTHLDIALIELLEGKPAACPDAPTPEMVAAAVKANSGEILTATEAGGLGRIPTDTIGDQPHLIVAAHAAYSEARAGLSGAPYVVNGIVVGIVKAVEDRTGEPPSIEIQPLADLPILSAAWLAPLGTAAGWKPFDVDQLPQDVRAMALRAREVRKEAEAARDHAIDTARQADEAAVETRRPVDHPTLAKINPSSDSEYTGVVGRGLTSPDLLPAGFGVLTTIRGVDAGNEVECQFKIDDSSCNGYGRLRFVHNSNVTLKRWEGQVCIIKNKNDICGAGVLIFKNEDRIYTMSVDGPAVLTQQILPDGAYRYTIELEYRGGVSNGLAVTWDQNGQVYAIGQWKDGNLEKDRKSELIPGSPQ